MKPYKTEAVYEDSSIVLMARVIAEDAGAVVQADVSSIALKIYDSADATAVISGGTLAPSVATTIFNTLQTDARWTKDATGYNFKHYVLPAYLPDGNKVYRFEFVLTMADGGKVPVVFEVPTVSLYSS